VDTNALIDDPDLSAFRPLLGPAYLVHILPVVLSEIDDLKRSGRTPELPENAKRADRRLKSLRDNGDVHTGARVTGEVYAIFDTREPARGGLPGWLDLNVPDDRFVAGVLRLQSDHPGSTLITATSDINLQNKLTAVGLPFIEPLLWSAEESGIKAQSPAPGHA
jgi:predicted ribonuclease YlaK